MGRQNSALVATLHREGICVRPEVTAHNKILIVNIFGSIKIIDQVIVGETSKCRRRPPNTVATPANKPHSSVPTGTSEA